MPVAISGPNDKEIKARRNTYIEEVKVGVSGTKGKSFGALDGGDASSVYGGTEPIDGGDASTVWDIDA